MKISPEIEEYFVSFTLVHEIPPLTNNTFGPRIWGLRKQKQEVALYMETWSHKPDFLYKLERAYTEVDSRHGTVGYTRQWFFERLAAAYLDWLKDNKKP
jgi:hypothetical protein